MIIHYSEQVEWHNRKLYLLNFFWCRALRMTSSVDSTDKQQNQRRQRHRRTLRNTKRSIIIIIIRFVANVCALGEFTWKTLRRRSRDNADGMQLVATATNAIVAVVLFHFSLPLVSLLFALFVFFFSSGAYRIFFSSQTICSLATRPQSRSRDQTTRKKNNRRYLADNKMII